MKEERIVLIGGLAYFSNQHLYLNFVSVLQCHGFYTLQDKENIDENQMLVASNELLTIAITSKKQLLALLSELPNLHKDDVLFFQKIIKGYSILVELAELLHRFLNVYLEGDDDNLEMDFLEFSENAQLELGRIIGYIS